MLKKKKCEIAKCKSDLSSVEEIIKKRKKFKNKKQVLSSESGIFIHYCNGMYFYQTDYFNLQFLLDCEESDDNMSQGSIPRYLSGNTFKYFIIL